MVEERWDVVFEGLVGGDLRRVGWLGWFYVGMYVCVDGWMDGQRWEKEEGRGGPEVVDGWGLGGSVWVWVWVWGRWGSVGGLS